jgi:sulfonate transport system permease protein
MRLPTTLTLPAKSWSAYTTPRPSSQRATSGLVRTLLGLSLPLLLLGLAELAGRQGWVATHLLPPPSELLRTLHALVQQDLATHVLTSSARVLAGFAIGSLVGVVLGAAVGLNRHIEAVIDPSLQALRAIPSLAWVPLLLIWLGIDEAPKIVLIALGAFFPVYLGLLAGIRNVDRKWVELGEVHGLGQLALTRRILLPAALPSLFTGLRGGLSLAWMFMVAAELIAASRGIGYLLTDGRETSRPDIVLAAILLLAVLGKLSDGLLKTVEARSLHWRDSFQA